MNDSHKGRNIWSFTSLSLSIHFTTLCTWVVEKTMRYLIEEFWGNHLQWLLRLLPVQQLGIHPNLSKCFVSGKSHRLENHVGFPKGQTAIKHHWTIVSMRFNIFQLNVFQCWFDTPFGNPVCQENFPLMFASHGCIYPLVISSMACWRILHLHLIFPAINLWLVRGFSS